MSVQGKGFLNEQPLTFNLPDGWNLRKGWIRPEATSSFQEELLSWVVSNAEFRKGFSESGRDTSLWCL